MCGIVAILNVKEQTQQWRQKALRMSQKIRHRGPDWSGIYCGGSAILAHERLSIVDPESGGQPLFSPDRKQVLAVNGEIYNHQDIRRQFAGKYDFQTGSDCEVILALYREKGIDFLRTSVASLPLCSMTRRRIPSSLPVTLSVSFPFISVMTMTGRYMSPPS